MWADAQVTTLRGTEARSLQLAHAIGSDLTPGRAGPLWGQSPPSIPTETTQTPPCAVTTHICGQLVPCLPERKGRLSAEQVGLGDEASRDPPSLARQVTPAQKARPSRK